MNKKIIGCIIGCAILIAVGLSLFTHQRSALASRSSNDDPIDATFRGTTPSNATIINALFGNGNIGTDTGFYTQYWSSNTCNTATMNVVNISPGVDTIPTSLNANTVYVLDVGTYTMTTGPIVFNGDCIALVGKRTSMLPNTGIAHITSNSQGLTMSNRNNIIIASLIQETTVIGNGIGIYVNTSTNSSVWPIDVISWDEGIFIENSLYIFGGGNTSSNRLGVGIDNNSTNIRIGDMSPDAVTLITGNEIGMQVTNSDHITINNADNTYNLYAGGMFENINNVNVYSGDWSHNGAGLMMGSLAVGGLFMSGGQNIYIDGGLYHDNDGNGLALFDINGLTIYGTRMTNNTWHGMDLRSGANITGINLVSDLHNNGSDYGMSIMDVQNIYFDNVTTTGNGAYGIGLSQVTGFTFQNINVSNNNVAGLSIYAGTSGSITNITGSTNTYGNGLTLGGSNGVTITNGYFSGNGTDGLYVNNNSSNIFMTNITSNSNADEGLDIAGVTNFFLANYTTTSNGGYGIDISESTSSGLLMTGSVSWNTAGGVFVNDNATDILVSQLDAFGNNVFGLGFDTATNNSANNIYAHENQGDGILFNAGADINELSFAYIYSNTNNGMYMYGASDNHLNNIISFGNIADGIALDVKSERNKIEYIQTYNNNVGIHTIDALSQRNTISNAISYNNYTNVDVYNYTTLNNIAAFNGGKGVIFSGPHNVLNNADVFNNQDGIYIEALSSQNNMNATKVYNNTNGISVNTSTGNSYNGLTLFANTTPLLGTNGTDAYLAVGVYSWAIAMSNNLAGTDPMTCNRAIQATNNAGSNLLQYPYCDTRNVIGGWTPTLHVQYTYFPSIYKQTLPVEFYLPLPNITTSGSAVTGMFVGDYTYTGTTQFGGKVTITGEQNQFTYQSGGFIYRNMAGAFDLEMLVNQTGSTNYLITGVNDPTYNGTLVAIPGAFGSTPLYTYPGFSLINQPGLRIVRVGYDDIDSQSNYYGFIRGIATNDNISITKNASSGAVLPGQSIGFVITVQNAGSDPAGFSQVIDLLPSSIDTGTVITSPVATYSGDINAYIWDIPVVSGNATYTFYLTGTIYTGTSDNVLTNTGYFISDQTSNGPDWSVYDEELVDILLPVNGTCGTAIGNTHYGQSTLNSGTIDLCGQGIVSGFVGPDGIGGYAWTCQGIYSGTNASCTADENRCSDTILDGGNGEQCDDGNTTVGDGCNASCQIEYPACTISANTSYTLGQLTTFSLGWSGFADPSYIDFGNGTGISGSGNINVSMDYTYPSAGVYTATLQVYNVQNPTYTGSCSFQVEILGVCGNNILEQGEQCDDGNTNPNDGCSDLCVLDTGLCTLQAIPGTGYTPFNVILNGTGSSGFTFDYIDYGDGTTGVIFSHIYTTSGVYDIIAYEYNMLSGSVMNSCTDQIVVYYQPEVCELLIQPGFEIQSHTTVPYITGGSILSEMTLTSTTVSTNPIVSYQRDIISSGTLLGSMSSPYVFDNTLISSGQGTSSIDLDFGAYTGDGNRPFIWVMLTVIDSSGYQAEYSTPLFRDHDDGGLYWILADTITDSDFNGFLLDITGAMLSSSTSGGLIPPNMSFRPDTGAFTGVVGIDRENDMINDEFFIYPGIYNYSNIYTTGTHVLNLNTSIGDLQDNYQLSHRTYPVACAVSCGNAIQEGGEQCDDGNLDNGDGCDSQCISEQPFCSTPLLPSFEIVSFQTGVVAGTGYSIPELILTDTTVATNTIVSYERHVYTSPTYFSYGDQGVLDDQRIVAGASTDTVTLDLSTFDYTNNTIWVELTVSDSSGYQGVAYYILSYPAYDYQSLWYDSLIETSFNSGGLLTVTGTLFTNTVSGGSIVSSSGNLSTNVPGENDTVTFIDWESDLLMDENFINDGLSYGTSHQYTTGLHLMRVYTASGSTGDAQALSYTSYPVICGDLSCFDNVSRALAPDASSLALACRSTCGDGLEQGKEQCDDGNVDDNDGCSSVCRLEQPSCDWFEGNITDGVIPGGATRTIDPNIYTQGYEMPGINRGDDSATGDIFTDNTHTYTSPGLYNGYLYIVSPIICSPMAGPRLDGLRGSTDSVQLLGMEYFRACGSTRPYAAIGAVVRTDYSSRAATTGWKGIESELISVMCPFSVEVPCTDDNQCSVGEMCLENGTCGTNQCEVVDILDPVIVYQWGYYMTGTNTGYVFTLNTPTSGTNYQYQWSLSGLDIANISGLQFSGSSTQTGVQIQVLTDDVPAAFTIGVTLEVTDGVIVGSISGVLSCDLNGSCSFSFFNYHYSSIDGTNASTDGHFNIETIQQNVTTTQDPGSLLTTMQVEATSSPEISLIIYACDINQWYDDMIAAGLAGEFPMPLDDFLDLYYNGGFPANFHVNIICNDTWDGALFSSDNVAYIVTYASGSLLGIQAQSFNYDYDLNPVIPNEYTGTIPFNISLLSGYDEEQMSGWILYSSNNVGIHYSNPCMAVCADGIVQAAEQCDDGNFEDGDGCTAQCNFEQRDCSWFTGMNTPGYAPHSVSLDILPGIYTGFIFNPINRGDGNFGNIFTSNTHMYNNVGSYNASIRVRPPLTSQATVVSQVQCFFPIVVLCTDDNQCQSGQSCLPDGTCGGQCTNGATNYPTCDQCGTGQYYCSASQQCITTGSTCDGCTNGATNYPTCDQCGTGQYYCSASQQCITTGSTCAGCTNGATNYPICDQCGIGQYYCSVTQSCKNNGASCGGGGGGGVTTDYCPEGDFSPSYYDGICGQAPQHLAAPVGKACRYDDEKYLTNGPFIDTLKHRGSPYIDVMQYSCMHRGRWTNQGEWKYEPDANITRAEVLKTFVKIEGVAFDDFTIETENKRYPKATPFADVSQDHWFAHYAQYAKDRGLVDGLTTQKNGLFLQPDILMTRYEAVKIMVIAYEAIHKSSIKGSDKTVLGDMVDKNNPYYSYVMKAEALGFISGIPQKDGSYDFKGKQYITRAEFAKIVANAFSDQLFDVQEIIVTHPIYTTIVKALQKVQGDKVQFLKEMIVRMSHIDEVVFMKTFKIRKMVFLNALYDTLLQPLMEEPSN